MNFSNFLLPVLFFPLFIVAQSKKEEILILNHRIDSLTTVFNLEKKSLQDELNKTKEYFKTEKNQFQNDAKASAEQNKNLIEKNQKNLFRIYDSLRIDRKKWAFDTISGQENHVCYFMDFSYPLLIKTPFNENTRTNLNKLLLQKSKEIPYLLANVEYKQFMNCETGRYNFSEELVKGHVIHAGEDFCSWCASQFYSSIEGIYIGEKYASVLFHFTYEVGGNWGHSGYSALNFDMLTGEEVKLNFTTNDWSQKNQFIQDITEIFSSNSIIDYVAAPYIQEYSGECNLAQDELKQRNLDQLCFYFKDDQLRLRFVNSGHGPDACIFDSKMTKLHNRMGY